MISFSEIGLNAELLKAIQEMGYEEPTPIQAEAIPRLLKSERDLIALAQTGTGKTAAFGLPTIQKTDISDLSTQTLILCPTRELCLQITKEMESYAKFIKGLNILAVYGGASIEPQLRALKRGAQIVVGTPGRTKDLMNRRKLKLENIKTLVLDEADEMLTMGFIEDLEEIMDAMPEGKQSLLFSATMSKDIMRVTKKYMSNAEEIAVAQRNLGADTVDHVYYSVPARERYQVLKRIADSNPDIYGIIFCRTRAETSNVAMRLMEDGYSADALHGEMSQAQRDKTMDQFRQRQLQLLVATDVAARGLDVNDLTHVINYNLPDATESYTHRSGRTGRAGKSGTSIAIVAGRDKRKIKAIEDTSGIRFTLKQVPTGSEIYEKQLTVLVDKIEKVEVNEKEIAPFLPGIYKQLEHLDREEIIKKVVYSEFKRFISYYGKNNDIKTEKGGKDTGDARSPRDRRRGNTFTRIFINIGKRNHLNPARLIGLINEGLDSKDATIGRIDIQNNFSFVEVDEDNAVPVIAALDGKNFGSVSLSLEISQAVAKPKYSGGGGGSGRGRSSGSTDGRAFGKKKKKFGDKKKFGGRGKRK